MSTFPLPSSRVSRSAHAARSPRVRVATSGMAAACLGVLAACGEVTAPLRSAPVQATSPASASPSSASMPAGTTVQYGVYAVHVPANVKQVRGVLLALGGPDTRGFADGTPFRAPIPAVEASLQQLGAMFRDLAAERGLAIVGTGRFGLNPFPNSAASDQQLFDALAQAAALTDRPELADAPILVYGLSGGGPEAVGLTERHPDRVSALMLRVPVIAGPLTGRALSIPAILFLAENDVVVNNTQLRAAFHAHRAAGAPWAMATERGAIHFTFSAAQRDLTVAWMRAVLPLGKAGPFSETAPQVGWLVEHATGAIAPMAAFSGDRSMASWLPHRPLAEQWAAYIGM